MGKNTIQAIVLRHKTRFGPESAIKPRVLQGLGLLTLVWLLGACAIVIPPPADTEGEGSADADMAMAQYGDPEATPAEAIEGAVLQQGTFQWLDAAPRLYESITGQAAMATHAGGTTVTVRLQGLQPNHSYKAHVHALPCAEEMGGAHFQFDKGGSEWPPNEIHLTFMTDAQGNGFMTAEDARAVEKADAPSVVLHEMDGLKIACADFP